MIDDAFDGCLQILSQLAETADRTAVWPSDSWQALERAGVLQWEIDSSFGGSGVDGIDLLIGLERLAGACLTTCFLLSQRQAAIRRIADFATEAVHKELLIPLATGKQFATVGLSQLTTSRQHGQPALIARTQADGFILEGTVPWVTGATRADHFVFGSNTDAGQQILFAVPAASRGLSVRPPFDLMALQGSMTAEVVLDGVHVESRWLLAGPTERVLTSRRGGAGGLETSCLALGLAGAAVDYLADEMKHRPELGEIVASLEAERSAVRQEMHRLAIEGGDADATAALRTNANALVSRATQAALMTAKGAGFIHGHPAQRWARQALFFLVWSCPRPTVLATLAQLASSCESPPRSV